jgi:hypothetical protein
VGRDAQAVTAQAKAAGDDVFGDRELRVFQFDPQS